MITPSPLFISRFDYAHWDMHTFCQLSLRHYITLMLIAFDFRRLRFRHAAAISYYTPMPPPLFFSSLRFISISLWLPYVIITFYFRCRHIHISITDALPLLIRLALRFRWYADATPPSIHWYFCIYAIWLIRHDIGIHWQAITLHYATNLPLRYDAIAGHYMFD